MKPILLSQILVYLVTPFLLGQTHEIDVMNLYEQNNKGSNARSFTPWHDWIYFSADDGVHGYELWAIGPEGVALQADLAPGVENGFPQSFTILEDRFYFSTRFGLQNRLFWIDEPGGTPIDLGHMDHLPNERSYFQGGFYYFKDHFLCRTDGETGRQLIIAQVGTRRPRHSASHSSPQVFGNFLYFVVVTPENHVTLWRSDGTGRNTREIAMLHENLHSPLDLRAIEMAELNGDPIVAVSARIHGVVNWNLWRVGEDSLIKFHSGKSTKLRHPWFRHFQQVGDVGYFVRGDEGKERLYRTDGSLEGTVLVPGAEGLLRPDKLRSHNGDLFFTSQEPHKAVYRLDSHGHLQELARFDDLEFEDRVDIPLVVGQDQRIYLFADMLDSAGTSLVRLETDGSGLMSIYAGKSDEWLVNEAGIFLTTPFEQKGEEIIRIDDSGVALVADLNQRLVPPPFGYSGNWVTSFRNQIYYLNQNDEGIHLFRLEDETISLFKTLESVPFRDLIPPRFFTHGNLLYLIYTDKDHKDHLWVTDGTAENTREIQGLAGETNTTLSLAGSNEMGWFLLSGTDDNRQLCFLGQEGVLKKLLDLSANANMTQFFFPKISPDSDVFPFLTILDNALVLWTTDGTPEQTKPMSTLLDEYEKNALFTWTYSGAGEWIIVVIYPIGVELEFGHRMWRFDEDAENGVQLIGDFDRVEPPGITRHKLSFPVFDFGRPDQWKWLEIDGTGVSVIPINDQMVPHDVIGGSEESGWVYYLNLAGDLLAWDGAAAHFLSEGNTRNFINEIVSLCGVDYLFHYQEGTLVIDRVVDPREGFERISSEPDFNRTGKGIFRTNDAIYFPAETEEQGRELWRLDDRGLHEVTQLRMGQASAFPFSLAATDQDLYFLALDDSLQLKMWRESIPNTPLNIQVRQLFGPFYLAYVEGGDNSSFLWRAENATILDSYTSSQIYFFNHGGARLTVTQEETARCTRRGELTLPLKNHRGSQSASENTEQQPRKR